MSINGTLPFLCIQRSTHVALFEDLDRNISFGYCHACSDGTSCLFFCPENFGVAVGPILLEEKA